MNTPRGVDACRSAQARRRIAMALLAVATAVANCASAAPLQLARLEGDKATLSELAPDHVVRHDALPAELETPLGSLWKLFVHAYLVDRQRPDPGYTCRGGVQDEVYCCERGQRIDRDTALVRSCSLYYAPARLGIDILEWQRYWAERGAPDWLRRLDAMRPQTAVRVAELLRVLSNLPAQVELRRVLLDRLLQDDARPALAALGGQLRIKTFSWHATTDPDARYGGFAGWLADGTPVWAGASGTGRSVLRTYAAALAQALPAVPAEASGECVLVHLFQRYPIAALRDAHGAAAPPGRLTGRFEVEFRNGQRLPIESQGELVLSKSGDGWRLDARLSREDYVARVLDREAAAEPLQAARALSIAIRSYLLQNAQRDGDCLAIADSSASQRVAPRPASAAATRVAAWTTELILSGAPVTYHLDKADAGRLSWQHAVQQANAGSGYVAILAAAYPRATLARWDRPHSQCESLDQAERWLRQRLPQWRVHLDREPGYEETREFSVCRLSGARPFVDRSLRRIHVRGLISQQDRLDLAHEYLHLAFAAHPRGQDEGFIEALARRLILE